MDHLEEVGGDRVTERLARGLNGVSPVHLLHIPGERFLLSWFEIIWSGELVQKAWYQ